MKKYISFMLLITVSEIVIGSQVSGCDSLATPKPRVRFASDVTIVDSPIQTRSSSKSDVSVDSLSPQTFSSHGRHYPGYLPKGLLTDADMQCADVKLAEDAIIIDTSAIFDPFVGGLDFSLSPDEVREIKREVTKYELSKKAPLYKQFLFFLGCTPHLRSSKSE